MKGKNGKKRDNRQSIVSHTPLSLVCTSACRGLRAAALPSRLTAVTFSLRRFLGTSRDTRVRSRATRQRVIAKRKTSKAPRTDAGSARTFSRFRFCVGVEATLDHLARIFIGVRLKISKIFASLGHLRRLKMSHNQTFFFFMSRGFTGKSGFPYFLHNLFYNCVSTDVSEVVIRIRSITHTVEYFLQLHEFLQLRSHITILTN